MLILIDAMGGDNAPEAVVNGCIDALNEMEGYDLALIGDREKIQQILDQKEFKSQRLNIIHAKDVITMEDSANAFRTKKESSMVVGLNLLKEKKGDVFLSAGNTKVLMTGATLVMKRIKGVDRPALAPVMPTKRGGICLIDAGANTTCKPLNYLQFGIMGSIFMREVFNVENPRVGLINNGTELNKGTDIVKQAHAMLAESNINFTGNIEGRDITDGSVDVAVCDGFVGNILLKFFEGIGSFLKESLKGIFSKNIISKIAAALIMGELKKFNKKIDYTEYGGAPLLGVNGKVMKAHGSSNAKAIKNAIFKAYSYGKSSVVEQICEQFKNMEVDGFEQSD